MRLFNRCKGLTKYNSAYLANQEASNHIGKWRFFKCRSCKGWHIKEHK